MLSPQVRNKLEGIAARIARREEVSLEDMTFITKWAAHNHVADRFLRQARRMAAAGEDYQEMDNFLNVMDLGDPDPQNHKRGFTGAEDIVEWFRSNRPDDWRQRD